MAHDNLWKETGTDITIFQPIPLAARLFGLPFLGIGVYLLYQFVDGALHPSEMTVAGWILLPAFTAVFLVPGWLLAVARKRIRLLLGARQAIEEFDFLLYTRRLTIAIPEQSHIVLRYEQGSDRQTRGPATTHTRTSYLIHVYLMTDRKEVLLALFAEKERDAAFAFARKAGSLLSIEVQDRLFEHGEVTAGGVVVERLEPDDAD